MNYYDDLARMEYYKYRPDYIPFIGDKYEQFRILQVGESHYIGQKYDASSIDKYDIEYMSSKWWNYDTQEMDMEYEGWYNTQSVIRNYMSGNRRKGHTIFTNFLKSFSKVVLHEEIARINYEESQKYEYLAFMNFYQMPALYFGMKYWDALDKSAQKIGNTSIASRVWNETVEHSSEVLDNVIGIIAPKIIVFTSISAYYAYKNYKAKHGISLDTERFIKSDHPGCSWWNRVKKGHTHTSREEFEEQLAKIFR